MAYRLGGSLRSALANNFSILVSHEPRVEYTGLDLQAVYRILIDVYSRWDQGFGRDLDSFKGLKAGISASRLTAERPGQ